VHEANVMPRASRLVQAGHEVVDNMPPLLTGGDGDYWNEPFQKPAYSVKGPAATLPQAFDMNGPSP
jgi:hypothetical protein